MALINTVTTGTVGTTVNYNGSGELTVQLNGSTVSKVTAVPAFAAYSGTTQNISNNVATKINIDTENFDTNSNYSTSSYRFTPTVAGYYQVNGVCRIAGTSIGAGNISIFLNGSEYSRGTEFNTSVSNVPQMTVSDIIYMNGSTDYIELYGLCNANSPQFQVVNAYIGPKFSAALIRSS